MIRTTTALVLLTVGATHASAQAGSNLYWLAGEIRGQMAVVRAQADATFLGCRQSDDVYDELEDLCRRMDRFEERLARGVASRGDLRRLARAAERVDRQACELGDAVDHALRRLRQPVHRPIGPVGPVGPVGLAPRHASARQFGFAGPDRTVFRLNVGGLSLGVCDEGRLHLGPPVSRFRGPPITRQIGFGPRPLGWAGDAQAQVLCHQMDRLRQLTGALSAALAC